MQVRDRAHFASLSWALLISMAAFTAEAADPVVFFSTGSPDGKIATLSRRPAPSLLETETADDFVLTAPTRITQATFTGLLPSSVPLSSVIDVEIELYHVFPGDSANPPSGNVPTRVNSPGDSELAAFDSAKGTLTYTTTLLNPSFTVANTVVDGIHKSPNQLTNGEGPATGHEVQFTVTFTPPVILPADHYFFRPEVQLTSGNFLWLSAPKPIVAPGTPFSADLQSWTRNAALSPDWLRIGTDISGQGPFNAAFSLTGDSNTSCVFSLSSSSVSVDSGSGTTGQSLSGSFTLNATNCRADDTWNAVSDSPRLLVTAGASGNGAAPVTTIYYSMYTNSTTQPRVAHITVAGQTFTVNQAGSTEPQAKRVVRALYQTILGREPDAGGWAFWTGNGAPVNRSGAVLFNQMADGFYTSPEFKNSGWLALNLYQAINGAPPTFAQWLSMVTQIRNQTLSATQAANTLAGSITNQALVQAAFQNGFGRLPNPNELNSAVTSLNGGQSKYDFLNSVIFSSSEFTSRTNPSLVQALFYTILLRDPDAGGFNFWLSQLDPPSGQAGIYYLYNPQPVTPEYTFKLAVIGQAAPPNPQLLGFLGSPEFQGLIQ